MTDNKRAAEAFGGFTTAEIREFIEHSEANEESIDFVTGDDANATNIIKDLLDEVDRLSLSSCADGGKDSSDARDAERYRFIQNSQWYVGPEPEGDTQGVSWCNFNCDQQPLDTHIDAAIAKEKK